MGIQINGQTDRISAVDGSFSIQDLAEVNVTGVATASNFKSGTSNVHSTGYECTNINATGIVTAASANFTGNVSVGGTLTYQDVTNIDSVGVITARAGVDVNNGHIVLDSGYSLQWSDSHERIEQSDGNLEFFTNNTEKVTISGGNLGIGITNPPNLLTLGASGGPTMRLADTTSGAFSIITGGSNGDLTFSADHGNAGSSTNIIFSNDGNQERLRIDSSGRLLIGRTSTSHEHPLQVQAASGANAIAIQGRSVDDQSEITFYENDNSTITAQIQQLVNRSIFRHRAGYLRFDSGGVTEKMRLDSSGNLILDAGGDIQDIQIKSHSGNSGHGVVYLRGNASNESSTIQLNHYGHADYM